MTIKFVSQDGVNTLAIFTMQNNPYEVGRQLSLCSNSKKNPYDFKEIINIYEIVNIIHIVEYDISLQGFSNNIPSPESNIVLIFLKDLLV